MLNTLLILISALALLGIIFEEKTHINKAKITLFFGTLSWVILFIAAKTTGHTNVMHGFKENITEIAGLWLFLMAAMTFVAYLNSKGMIENLIHLFLPGQLTELRMLLLTALYCFIFSSLADNITATLVSVAMVLSLKMPPKKTTKFLVLVVFAVNSGGVSLITGDVTTLMIFLDQRVTIPQLLLLSIPSFIGTMTLALLLSRGLTENLQIEKRQTRVARVDLYITLVFLSTILGAMAGNVLFDIPPMLTFLTGLSTMFLVARFFNADIDKDPIMDYVRLIEFDTLLFFLGVLLVVGALKEINALSNLAEIYHVLPAPAANFAMGLLSAIIDNVPLTAAVLKSSIEMGTRDWLALTYASGVGGSLLIIGSAAGIVAMSKVPGLTFGLYGRYFVRLLAAYATGFGCVYLISGLLL